MGKTLEYIGPKQDGERHMRDATGIEWKPGDMHAVTDAHASEFLKHPTSWREVAPRAPAEAPAAAPSDPAASALPEWVKKGVELGATDDQLEAIAQAGGPETEQGAALWMDATGAAFGKAAAPPAKKRGRPPGKTSGKKAK